MNFLYCFDENYNIQAYLSIYSLLENVDNKINIYIIHKDPRSFRKYKKKILNHPNAGVIETHKFMKNINFPKLEEAHVSEATYYRLFITDYLTPDIDHLIYLDADTVVINNVSKDLEDIVTRTMDSSHTISAKTEEELTENTKRLKMINEKYFNAGVMIIDYVKWNKQNLSTKLINKMKEIESEIVFWDQDVLNSFFDGSYQELDNIFNFKIDVDDKKQSIVKKEEAKIVHYVGKSKPWTVRGSVKENSKFYQSLYRQLFYLSFHIQNNWKRQAYDDLITYYKIGVVKNLSNSAGFVVSVIYFLLKRRAK
tara:strand:+ start:3835 stop:4764 length:930 start_codon:yes stop_codon:yes gene_type:complete